MSDFALKLPVNGLSFGQVSICILNELYKEGLEPCLFPINEDISAYSLEPKFVQWLKDCIKKSSSNHRKENPVFQLWHLNTTALDNPSRRNVMLSFYELDSPTKSEINIANNIDKLAFTCNHSKDIFQEKDVQHTTVIPLGFDSLHFSKLDKQYYDDGRIVFNLCGKLEKRKRHQKVISSWAKRFGGDKRYHLQCSIHNHFLKKEMPALINRMLDGKKYFNIQFLDFMSKNNVYNDYLNSADIILGCSGGEGWGLPEFHSVAIGKHAVITNATGYKEWANEANSVLLEPDSKIDSADGVFFHKGSEFNQGKIFDFNEDAFIESCEKAIKRVESNRVNKEGLKLQKEFTYKRTTNDILDLLYDL